MKIFKALTLSIVMLLAIPVCAENGMNSPYTRFGFGQLSAAETGANKGMGGTGIGVHHNNQINMLNPASYAAVDTLTFLLDVGMSLSNTNLSEGGVKMNARSSTFDYIAMQFRLMPRLGFTLGITPLSNIGYNFSESKPIYSDEEGEVTATNIYYGSGGLRQVTAGLGYSPIKGLSIGANFSYVYGEIYHYVYNQYSDNNVSARSRQYAADISTYNIDLGLQYQLNLGKRQFTLGATYCPGHVIDDEVSIIETLSANESHTFGKLSLPTKYGAGLSYTYDNRLTVAADYSMEQYSTVEFFGTQGVDRHHASAGIEYIPEQLTRKLLRSAHYRAGVHYATAHYTINGHQGPTEYGATIGIGFPIRNRWNGKSIINISGQYVHVRPNAPGMITENSLRLNIGLSFNETWFDKWRIQ